MSAIKPATSLPWTSHQNQRFGYAIRDAKGGNVANRTGAIDAAYIVHACNAYPELVAFVQDVARDEHAVAARALLAKLGEGA